MVFRKVGAVIILKILYLLFTANVQNYYCLFLNHNNEMADSQLLIFIRK